MNLLSTASKSNWLSLGTTEMDQDKQTTGGSIQKDLMVRNYLCQKVKITPWQHFMKDFGGSEGECDFLWISSEGLF